MRVAWRQRRACRVAANRWSSSTAPTDAPWVMKGWQAMDGLETAERVRLAFLLASLRRLRGHGGAAPDEAARAPDEAGRLAAAFPLDDAGGDRVERVVAAPLHEVARVEFRAVLSHEDLPRVHDVPTEALDAESLTRRFPPVFRRPARFFRREPDLVARGRSSYQRAELRKHSPLRSPLAPRRGRACDGLGRCT